METIYISRLTGDVPDYYRVLKKRTGNSQVKYTKTSDITIKIGKYTISKGTQPGKIWIEQEGGEGGDFDEKLLAIWLEMFYEKNF